MSRPPYLVDPEDPRAPSQELWDAMSEEERERVVDALPSETESAYPPEGDVAPGWKKPIGAADSRPASAASSPKAAGGAVAKRAAGG